MLPLTWQDILKEGDRFFRSHFPSSKITPIIELVEKMNTQGTIVPPEDELQARVILGRFVLGLDDIYTARIKWEQLKGV